MTTDTKQKNTDDIDELRASIDRLTKDVASLSHSLTDILKSRAGQAAGDISDGVRTAAGEVSEKARDSKDAIERTIRDRPFQSLLAAFGTGLLIAQLFRKHGSD
ncbi:MAG: hypothetical protein RIM72_13285 [Alphaproteobacteria bacterium]